MMAAPAHNAVAVLVAKDERLDVAVMRTDPWEGLFAGLLSGQMVKEVQMAGSAADVSRSCVLVRSGLVAQR